RISCHTSANSAGSMRCCVIGAGVTDDATAIGNCLINEYRTTAVLVRVVGAAGEAPVGCAARNIGERSAEAQAAACRRGIGRYASANSAGSVRCCVIVAGVADDATAISNCLINDDRHTAVLVRVVSAAGEAPVGCAARNICERSAEAQAAARCRRIGRYASANSAGSVRRCVIGTGVADDATA